MADYLFRYRMQQPQARLDGSGMLDHDIVAIYSEDAGQTWEAVPARHQTFVCPADEVQTCLAGPNIPTLYKAMLARNIATVPEAVVGWDAASMTLMLDNNTAARVAAVAVAELPVSWPYEFAY